MRRVIIILVLLLVLVIVNIAGGYAEVQTLPPQKQGDCVIIPQTCANCTYVNVTAIKFPNSTVYYSNAKMTKIGVNYNYTFCLTNDLGKYIVTTCGNVDGIYTCVDYDFEVTPNGMKADTSDAIFYFGALVLLILAFILTVYSSWSTKNFSWVVGGFCFSYILLVGVLFVSWQIATNFLAYLPFISDLLFVLMMIGLVGFFPFILIMFVYILRSISNEKKIRELVGMGYTESEAKGKIRR